MRTCTHCGGVRSLGDFPINRSGRLNSWCRPCYAVRAKEWYRQNRTRASAANRARYIANRESRRQATRDWYAQNRDRALAYHAEYRKANPDLINARRNRWRLAHPEEAREYSRLTEQRRRARKRAVLCDFTTDEWLALLVAADYRCVYCGVKSDRLTQDHVIPLALGGPHTASNIVPACSRCNKRKWIKTDWTPATPLGRIPANA